MTETIRETIRVLGQDIACASPAEARRLKDLGAALEARLGGAAPGTPAGARRLVLTALALMDDAQSAAAALVRAHGEIDRLNDLLLDERAPGLVR